VLFDFSFSVDFGFAVGEFKGESYQWLAAAPASHFFCALKRIGLNLSDIQK